MKFVMIIATLAIFSTTDSNAANYRYQYKVSKNNAGAVKYEPTGNVQVQVQCKRTAYKNSAGRTMYYTSCQK
ncbi:MAG: hypothetical protein M9962_11965 [Oligoflexia bacterium]|nr:hypothetical protein [Oligoflexia bacterium]